MAKRLQNYIGGGWVASDVRGRGSLTLPPRLEEQPLIVEHTE